MGDAGSQLWLTSAISNDDVVNALNLCFSLKKTLTIRKIAVIVSKEVSSSFRKALCHGFDFLFNLEEYEKPERMRTEDFVKLYALTLKSFEKVVYLKPSMLIIKNSDELFNIDGETRNARELAEGEASSALLVRPSLEKFRILIKDIHTKIGKVNFELEICGNNQNEENIGTLHGKYNRLLSPRTGFVVGNATNISIIDLENIPVQVDSQKFGLVGKLILRERNKIYFEATQPLLESVENDFPMTGELQSYGSLMQNKESIAIVGMSCRYPSANNLEEFWQLLLNGEDGTGTPPEFRWLRQHTSVYPPDCRKTNAGFLKYPVEEFDSKFFGISPKEMESMDPQHRLLHEIVWEALEDAAVNPNSLDGTNGGVFIGSWLADYRDIMTRSGDLDFYRKYMGNSIGAGAARISHFLGLTGPSIATESGCSSAMVAVHLACKSLQRGESSFALACGVNLLLRPFDKDFMPMVISPTGQCKTFDAKADGYARAEGCGVLMMKRFSDAVRDGDKIWALIRGSGMAQEGLSKSLGTPTIHSESLAMTTALQDARVLPEQVSYVETHGTGTAVGDPLEVASIEKAYHSKNRKEPLLIGSVKTNVGHTESCSGITGIMKVVLAMQHEVIPPHRNFETLNPAINLEAVPARIPLRPVDWPRMKERPRYAGVSSFGITGTDSHVILEESPSLPTRPLVHEESERPLSIMKISAKTDEALDILLDKYKSHIIRGKFSDLAYTANVGRADFNQRAVVIANSNEDAIKNIEQNKTIRGDVTPKDLGKTCFLFTGQGSQYPGMAKHLYQTSPVFRMHFEYCNNILKEFYNIDITPVLWSKNAEKAEVSRTIYSQTSIFCVEYALMKLWESWGIKPDFALGHSLGEFAAAVCCGILSVEDAIKLVAERSRLIDQLPQGKMLVVKADKQRVDSLLNEFADKDENRLLDYAALNSPEQTVVAGDSELIMQFAECCKEADLKCIVLDATHAFHSKHMDSILDEYRKIARTVKKNEVNSCKYISGMRGALLEGDQIDSEYWVQHTREKVLFMDASRKAIELGCEVFIEVGPQPILSALTMMNTEAPLTCLPSLKRNENEWETLLNTLAKLYVKGFDIDWKGFEQFYNRKKVQLPHYPFIGKKYWTKIQVTSSTIIHPILGSPLPNASSTKLFQSTLSLSNLEYMKDHCIGDKIIFPGAAYLEMCLAAGHASLYDSNEFLPPPNFTMRVENLAIQAPLQLHDNNSCQLQTVVELPENQLRIKIFSHLESELGNKWLTHAEASFSVPHTSPQKMIQFDKSAIMEQLKKPANVNMTKEMYDKLAVVGLKFGDTFKSLEKVWKDEETNSLLFKVKIPAREEEKQKKYIVHPVLLDAMIQAIMMLCQETSLNKLSIPIKIGKFTWFAGTDSTEIYIHVFNSKDDDGTAYLIDEQGKLLAEMSSVDFVNTTVRAVESVLEQQVNAMPEMWEEVWRSELDSLQYAVDLEKASERFYTNEFANQIESEYNQLPAYETETFNLLEKLAYLNSLRAIFKCGWKPIINDTFEEDALLAQLNIQKNFKKYFNFMLNMLESEGILKNIGSTEGAVWKVIGDPPTLEEVSRTLESFVFKSNLVGRFQSTLLLSKYGENLAAILRGEQSALSILFPENGHIYPSLSFYYEDYSKVFKRTESTTKICRQRLSLLRDRMEGKRFILRILEVGAGTGSYTEQFLNCLEEENIEFEYTYTDISPAFFSAAEKRFEKYAKQMQFKKLNIEEDPIEQGFIPQCFDYIFMADVIHATKDLRESLRNLHVLMKPFAKLDILDGIEVNKFVTFLFGALEGYWRFQDFDIRPSHCIPSIEIWKNVLQTSEFEVDGMFPVVNDHEIYLCAQKTVSGLPTLHSIATTKVWLVFHEPSSQISNFLVNKISGVTSRKIIVVTAGPEYQHDDKWFTIRQSSYEDFARLLNHIKNRGLKLEGVLYCWALDEQIVSQDEILLPYFNLTQTLLTSGMSAGSKLITVINGGVVPLEGKDLSHFHTSTLWGFTKSLKNENTDLDCRCIEASTGSENVLLNVFHEIWRSENASMVAFHGNSRYTPKLQSLKTSKISNKPLSLPKGTDRFQLILPASKSIQDLQFGPLDAANLEDDEVEIRIIACALNFRDVLSVIKPSDDFMNVNTVGFDFAGVVNRKGKRVTKWEKGDKVFGCNIHFTAMPSHITLYQDLVLPLPEHLNFCEGATIPAVYKTSLKCLKEIAKIQKEDKVLIHTASGGVGLSAIQICQHVGCTIIATSGSKRKQNYLRSLGIEHIFHSRNTKFADQILELTNGRGVDVVLNSLTSEGFKEATLKACAKGARFVEMSKLNIWTEEQVKQLRPDVDYTTIDLTLSSREEWISLLTALDKLQKKNVVKPIPYVRFDSVNVRDALEYMQKAKHIGKIVCMMPEIRKEQGEMKAFTPLFNERSTYLITGGLGGIGFVVCQWMVEKGAKNVVLAGRSSPNAAIKRRINEMNSSGAKIVPVQLDIGNFEQCQDLIEIQIAKMSLPPLKGIMHCAGTLADGLIINQDWEKLSSTFNSKINGTLNLHELTNNINLEHFVLFSSVVALFGSPGQSNHSVSNSFEDAFCHYRNSIGLPATTINWGAWGEVGIATDIELPGMKALSNLQGMAALEHVFRTHRTQTAVFNVTSFKTMSKLLPNLVPYLDERIWNTTLDAEKSTPNIESSTSWQQYESALDLVEKVDVLKSQLKFILRNTLKLDENEIIGDDVDMQLMGVDSLMFVEIRNCLQTLLGSKFTLTANSIRDCNTVSKIASRVVSLIEGALINDIEGKPTMKEVEELMREDCKLPELIRPQPGSKIRPATEIKRILITGCTGTFGPYVLKILTNLPQITQVVCLMREVKQESLEKRLKRILNGMELLSKVDMKKVKCVAGDVAEPHLGLKSSIWEELSETMDAVFNCAASVQHIEYYRKRDGNQKDMRAVNIGGTTNVLEFACERNLKHVFHASSLLAVSSLDDETGHVSEKWPEVGDFDGYTTLGYPVTKFVGDVLMKQAVERGIPCKVFRFPLMSGESETGRCLVDYNHILLMHLFVLKTGVIPSAPYVLPMLPVDICADVGVKLFFQESAPFELYNVIHSQPDLDQEFVSVAKEFGYTVNIVEFSEFSKRVMGFKGEEGKQSPLELFKELYQDDDTFMSITSGSPVLGLEGGSKLKPKWWSSKLAKFVPNFLENQKRTMDYVRQDLMFCKSQGWFEKFGL